LAESKTGIRNVGGDAMMKNKDFFCFNFSIMIAVLFLGIIGRTGYCEASTLENEKNRLVIAISGPVVSLDPAGHRSRDTQIVLKNIFDSLTTRDVNMNVAPQLAESWKALNDTTWEFGLRRGVKFHNGDDFTGEDVKFSLERLVREGALDGKTSPRKSLMGPLLKVKIVNKHTVHIITEKPWPILPLMLTLQEIVPKDYITKAGIKQFREHPIGAGPFKFSGSEGGKLFILERFEDYYGGSPKNPPVRKAPLKALVFKYVPEKIERIAMLKKGECDIITHVGPEAVGILKRAPDIEVLTCPATRSYFAEINCAKVPFNDLRIRHAINHAIDKQIIIDRVLQGYGTVLPTTLLSNAFAYNASLNPYEYNPEIALKLLRDADFPKERSVIIKCSKSDKRFAGIIALFLAKVGIKSEINIADSYRPKITGENAKWDIFVGSWGNSTLDPVGILVPKFKSNGRGNFSKYSNNRVNKLLAQAEAAMDKKEREKHYKKVQEIIYKDAPMIFGYAATEHYGVRKRVKNFIPSSSGMMNMHDVYTDTWD